MQAHSMAPVNNCRQLYPPRMARETVQHSFAQEKLGGFNVQVF